MNNDLNLGQFNEYYYAMNNMCQESASGTR